MPSSFDGEEFDDGGQDIQTIGRELDVVDQALHDECREVERLRACLLVVEMALGVMNEETAVARATDTYTHVGLANK